MSYSVSRAHFRGGLHLLLPGLLAAVALHTGYNYLLVRPALATLATLLVLPFVIYLVFEHSERILRNWIEADLESDVQLLESISSGTFLGSYSGRYLQALRDRFRGDELADMLCYLRVHGEPAVRAKGVLLLARRASPSRRSTLRRAPNSPSLASSNVPSAGPACSRCDR